MFGFVGITSLNNEIIGLIFYLAAFDFFFLVSFSVAFIKILQQKSIEVNKGLFQLSVKGLTIPGRKLRQHPLHKASPIRKQKMMNAVLLP